MIKEKITPEELALVEVLRHPLFCAEFIRNISRDEKDKWVHSQYQKEMLCDFSNYVTFCTGRAIGKTETLVDKIIWYALNNFYDESVVFTVPNRVHLDPPFMKMVKWFRNHPLLMHYVDRSSINMGTFKIRLKNKFILDCRIAGQTNSGANVVGLHIPFILIDEAAFYPWGTFLELLPTLNTFQPGFQLLIAGVPDGKRERSVLYYADQIDKEYTKHRVSALMNPRYSAEDDERNTKQYKGRQSQEYVHMVLGQHGAPVFTMFERNMMGIEPYETHIARFKGKDFKEDSQFCYRAVQSIPAPPHYFEDIVFGIDLGFTDPTVIQIMYRLKDLWYIHARVVLNQVDYPDQEKFIDLLDTKFKPRIIGIDEGNIGKSFVQHLHNDQQYVSKDFKKKVIPIQFGGQTQIDFDESGEEIAVRTKQFAMQRLQSLINNRQIIFSKNDEEMISELERTSYTRTESGELKYFVESLNGRDKGEDHNTQALCCAIMAWWKKYESNLVFNESKLLKGFSWAS